MEVKTSFFNRMLINVTLGKKPKHTWKRNHYIRWIKMYQATYLSTMLIFTAMLIQSSTCFGSCLFSREYGKLNSWAWAHPSLRRHEKLLLCAKISSSKQLPPAGSFIEKPVAFRFVVISIFQALGYIQICLHHGAYCFKRHCQLLWIFFI